MSRWPRPFLIGMCHLPPLPGSPRHALPMDRIVEHAVQDAGALRDSGFDALLIENFGDAPFSGGRIEPWATAALAVVAAQVKSATGLPIGVNALRNDALAALGVAAAAGADFVRVNVLVGVSSTDQGFIEGPAAELLRARAQVAPSVEVFADAHVKHAVCVSQPDIALAAEEAAYRGQADALIVSGATTGRPADRPTGSPSPPTSCMPNIPAIRSIVFFALLSTVFLIYIQRLFPGISRSLALAPAFKGADFT